MKVLCGDIGGTNTRLALFEVAETVLEILEEETYKSLEYPSLEIIVSEFLQKRRISSPLPGCFGIAGPIKNGICQTTNLPWVIRLSKLVSELQTERVYLLNDLQANAYGILALKENDFVVLNKGDSEARGNASVISAGTGLGEAGLYWDGMRHHPFACEGGHGSFSPGNELQVGLLKFLFKRFSHVSWERVLSGPGLLNLYEFLCEYRNFTPSKRLVDEMQKGDSAAVVTKEGLSGKCRVCAEALDVFACLYGAEAGNLALKVMATGGVYMGGGIAPKIIEKLRGPHFMEGFLKKGRMQDLLEPKLSDLYLQKSLKTHLKGDRNLL
jgi:glucokinase (EC 2.7.1.2)